MEFQFSKRAESFQPNIFNILNEKRQALIESGKKIYNMSVGTPDFPPAQHVLDVVSEAAKNPGGIQVFTGRYRGAVIGCRGLVSEPLRCYLAG